MYSNGPPLTHTRSLAGGGEPVQKPLAANRALTALVLVSGLRQACGLATLRGPNNNFITRHQNGTATVVRAVGLASLATSCSIAHTNGDDGGGDTDNDNKERETKWRSQATATETDGAEVATLAEYKLSHGAYKLHLQILSLAFLLPVFAPAAERAQSSRAGERTRRVEEVAFAWRLHVTESLIVLRRDVERDKSPRGELVALANKLPRRRTESTSETFAVVARRKNWPRLAVTGNATGNFSQLVVLRFSWLIQLAASRLLWQTQKTIDFLQSVASWFVCVLREDSAKAVTLAAHLRLLNAAPM